MGPATPYFPAFGFVALLTLTACRGNGALVEPTSLSTPRGTIVQTSPVVAGSAVGSAGGGPLPPGTLYPPTDGGQAILYRDNSCLRFTFDTTGLPPGAYDLWMVIENYPQYCGGPPAFNWDRCGLPDYPFLQDHVDVGPVQTSEGWRAGDVVGSDGALSLEGGICVGERFGEPAYQHLFGPGLLNPLGSEILLTLLYHGPASDDPEVRYWQTHGGAASCQKDANGGVWPTGQVVCPQLQNASFPAPPDVSP